MLIKLKNYINTYHLLQPGERVCVGVSGGADSLALVFALKKLGYNVFAVHVEHGIRGDESLHDAAFVSEFCASNSIQCIIEHICIPSFASEHHLSLEDAARQKRYELLNKHAQCSPIAVAHNKNDQAETVLMNLMRGSGLSGLCAMQPKNRNVVRPFLDISRAEIEAFCAENNIKYVTDSTNADVHYTRNRIRQVLLPLLQAEFNPDAINVIASAAALLQEDNRLIDALAEEASVKYIKNERLLLTGFDTLSPSLKARLVRRVLAKIGLEKDVERPHVNAVLSLCSKQSGKKVSVCKGVTAVREYDSIVFNKCEPSVELPAQPFSPLKQIPFNSGLITSEETQIFIKKPENPQLCEYIDLDRLPGNTVLRTRLPGDIIAPLGTGGHVKLKEYLIDKKIPASKRSTLPLIACGNEILVIIGVTVSRKVAVCPETKKILKIMYKEKQDV